MAALLALVLCFAIGTWALDRAALDLPAVIAYRPVLLVVNAMPGLLLAATFLVVTRRLYASMLLAFGLQALLFRASAIKLDLLAAPVTIHDLAMVRHAEGLANIAWHYVDSSLVLWLALAVLVWLWLLLREKPVIKRFGMGSVVLAAVVAVSGTWMISGKPLPLYDKTTLRFEAFSPVRSVLHAGLIGSLVSANSQMIGNWRLPVRSKWTGIPAPVVHHPATPRDDLPDLIMVQAESLFDPNLLKQAGQIGDVLPRLRELLKRGTGGPLEVPTFGGGTIRTEFEALTGIPLSALPNVSYPYLELDNGDLRSVASELDRHGYRTIAVHPNNAATWGRERVFKRMGFQQFVTLEDFPKSAARDGYYISDHALVDEVTGLLKESTDPHFIFAISIEGHGPFDSNPVARPEERDSIKVPASLSTEGRRELQNYLYHAAHADRELGRLLDILKQRKRRSILVVYGDHLPGFRRVYDELGFADDRDPVKQPTFWLMIDSAAPSVARSDLTIASWMLPSVLLHQSGLDDDDYFPLVGKLGARLVSDDSDSLPGFSSEELRKALDEAAFARISGQFEEKAEQADGVSSGK
ncbi:MAG: LTA synthase family protein [Dokdonella sp.]